MKEKKYKIKMRRQRKIYVKVRNYYIDSGYIVMGENCFNKEDVIYIVEVKS